MPTFQVDFTKVVDEGDWRTYFKINSHINH